MFFAGQLPRPPWETRTSVEQMAKRLDRAVTAEGAYVDRFRLQTLQARFMTFVELWDRGLRAREEGRPGPFDSRRPQAQAPVSEEAAAAQTGWCTSRPSPIPWTNSTSSTSSTNA